MRRRPIFAGTLGWFDGNPTNLARLSPADSAARMVALAGGADAVMAAAESASATGDLQWAVELADQLIFAGEMLPSARSFKAMVLRQMADGTINAPTRNYYLLSARELEEQNQ